jgi:dTDP-4-dehydrorhamnose reductase
VVRTAWLYGEHGGNFIATMLRLAAQRDTVDVVDDQHGQPTWTAALAARLAELGTAALSGAAPAGAYHATASGQTTWYGLARAVFAEAGLDPARVRPTTTDRFPRPAPRPRYSVLGHGRWALAGLAPMGDWRAALAEALRRPAFADLVPAG